MIDTPRLVLRKPLPADLGPASVFWASERSHMMGGPWTAEQTARETEDLYAQWSKHGFSLFTAVLKSTGAPIGGIGPFFPDTHPEPELGWSLWDARFEGQGLAFEAAVAARDWFFATTDYTTAVSYTDPDNHRSHRLCERMGAVVDDQAATPYAEPTLTYRHTKGMGGKA